MFRALSALLLAGCATAGPPPFQPSPLLSAGWKPPEGRQCSLFKVPETLPDAADLIDARAARRVLEGDMPGEGTGAYAVVEVVYDSLGALHRTRVVESDLPESAQQALTRTVAKESPFSTGGNARGGALVRLMAREDSLPLMQVGWTEWCLPMMENNDEIADLLHRAAGNVHDPLLSGRQVVVEVEVHADSTGRVVEARFVKRSGYPQVDEMVAAVVPHLRFTPPLLDRRPVDEWMHIPLRFIFPPRSARTSTPAEH
ncbi:MAG TPA: energy transducer TonB [Longimicrobiaceae bacterium]|nr:energy transducer TonB [Longimicrobiaceae bacterium]